MKISKLHLAIIEVTKDVKNIDKDMTIGKGANAYAGVADKDVKQRIGQSMAKNGLTCLCIDIQPTIRVDRWTEEDPWSKSTPKAQKQKQSVFTEILAKYKITHAETNESEIIMGYGHGVDPQDKSAGKATTYALKNALLYSFLVPTGSIDDTDATHSSDTATPKQEPKALPPISDEGFDKYFKFIAEGTKDKKGIVITVDYLRARHTLNAAQESALLLINLEQ